MTETIPSAQLAYLSSPEKGVVWLNVAIDDELQRVRLNRDQLFRLNAETADVLLRDFK